MFSSNYHLLICSENHESHSPRRTNWCLTDIITYILSPRLSSFSRILRSVNFISNKPIFTIVGNLYALITAQREREYWFCLLFENATFLICIINKTYCLLIVGGIYAMLHLHYISHINISYTVFIALEVVRLVILKINHTSTLVESLSITEKPY